MTEGTEITPRQLHETPGAQDWRVLAFGACAHFRTVSFSDGLALVQRIGALSADAGVTPDVDLRPGGVTVRLFDRGVLGLTAREVDLAVAISEAAGELGASADPTRAQDVNIAIDAAVAADVMPFWRAVLGYEPLGDEDLVDPDGRWPGLWFQQMETPRTERNRVHVDLFVAHDEAEARIAAALAAGGRLVSDRHAPAWWTLADAEGNEVDIATSAGRE